MGVLNKHRWCHYFKYKLSKKRQRKCSWVFQLVGVRNSAPILRTPKSNSPICPRHWWVERGLLSPTHTTPREMRNGGISPMLTVSGWFTHTCTNRVAPLCCRGMGEPRESSPCTSTGWHNRANSVSEGMGVPGSKMWTWESCSISHLLVAAWTEKRSPPLVHQCLGR